MKILKQSKEELTKVELYNLLKNPSVKKMSEVEENEVVKVSKWAIFEDINKDGDINEILSIMDADTGNIYATNSPTFKRGFEEIMEIFEEEGVKIKVVSEISKNGRTFIQPIFVEN